MHAIGMLLKAKRQWRECFGRAACLPFEFHLKREKKSQHGMPVGFRFSSCRDFLPPVYSSNHKKLFKLLVCVTQ